MKKKLINGILLSTLLVGMSGSAYAAESSDDRKPYWQAIQVVSVNKEYPRSMFMTYDTREEALSGKFESSPYYQLLNGTWKFYFVDSYKQLPDNITDVDIDMSGWHDIKVPGNWEVLGFGTAISTTHG